MHRREGDGDRPHVSEAIAEPGRVALSPERLRELLAVDEAPRIAAFEPSPDGAVLGFAVDGGTGRHGDWHFLELDSGGLLVLGYSGDFMFERPEWFADSSGFYQPTRTPDGRHRFQPRIVDPAWGGLAARAKPVTLSPDDLDIGFNKLGQLSPDGRHLLVSSFTPTPRKPYWLVDTRTGTKRRFFPEEPQAHDAVCFGAWGDDRHFVALDFRQAERGRIVEIPVHTSADGTTWRELVAESDLVLRAVTVRQGRLFVCALEEASRVHELYSRDGRRIVRVPSAPFAASITGLIWRHILPDDAFVSQQETFDTASASYVYDESAEAVTVVGRAPRKLRGIDVERRFAEAADGVRLPYFVARSESTDATRPAPALVYAYGGGNIAWLPTFLWQHEPFIRAGASTSTRSFEAAANTGRVGGAGQSGAQAALLRRPLRRCRTRDPVGHHHRRPVGVVRGEQRRDDRRGGADPAARTLGGGHPPLPGARWARALPIRARPGSQRGVRAGALRRCERPEFAKIIAAYSPYQNVRDGVGYPAVLLMLGLLDPLCLPSNGRRMIARLQAASASGKPAIARFYDRTGHDFAEDEGLAKAQVAELPGVRLRHTGLEANPEVP